MVVQVDVWSDIACPWCWVGKRNLEEAARRFDGGVSVTWHAFELDPSAPRRHDDDIDLVGRLATKYGASRAQAEAMIERMTQVGTQVGLDFRFDRVQPTSTFDAHRLLHLAGRHGKQGELEELLLRAYMHEGRSVAEPDTLQAAAVTVGLPEDEAREVIEGQRHAQDVRDDEALAHAMGVTGVPFFVFGGRYAVAGAQPPDVLLSILERARDEGLEQGLQPTAADACGPDGCSA